MSHKVVERVLGPRKEAASWLKAGLESAGATARGLTMVLCPTPEVRLLHEDLSQAFPLRLPTLHLLTAWKSPSFKYCPVAFACSEASCQGCKLSSSAKLIRDAIT